VTGRHAAAGGAWDRLSDAQLARAVREWQEAHPVPDLPPEYCEGAASALAEPGLSPMERATTRGAGQTTRPPAAGRDR